MSKILVLGGAGAMANETTQDLVKTSDFEKITIASRNIKRLEEFAAMLKDDRVSVTKVDASNVPDVVKLMRGYDVVANGLPRDFALSIIKASIETRVDYLDLISPSLETLALDSEAKRVGISCVGGVGMTPGVTNLLAQLGVEWLDSVEQIDIDFAAFRPAAHSPALLHVLLWEFSPRTKHRYCYEDGKLIDNPPFSGARIVNFPKPIGEQTTYFVPHGESVTLSKNVKGVKRVYIRGCFPPEAMRLVHVCHDFGIFTAEAMEFEGKKIVPLDFLRKYLLSVPEGDKTEIWGYSIQVELTGMLNDKKVMQRFVTSHPPMDEWGGTEAYARNVGYPLSIGAQLLAQGKARKKGVDGAEMMLPAQEFVDELQKRGIKVSEEVVEL